MRAITSARHPASGPVLPDLLVRLDLLVPPDLLVRLVRLDHEVLPDVRGALS